MKTQTPVLSRARDARSQLASAAMLQHSTLSVKPLQAVHDEKACNSGGLQRHLGMWSLMAIGIGATVGAGIFVLSGVAAHDAGPAVVIAFLFAGIACTFSALAYAEMSAALPVTGSAYTYTFATLGEGFAWLVGWNLLLEYALGASLVARGFSGYCAALLKDIGVTLPTWSVNGPLDGGIVDLPAVIIVLIMSVIVTLGIRECARCTAAMVVLKLLAVGAVILIGATRINPQNWTPFVAEGWGAVFKSTALVFLAFVGFDIVSSTAAEVRNPGRDLPRGILGTLVICTVLYCLMAGTLTGMVPYKEIDPASPITSAFEAVQMPFVGGIIAVGALVGMASVLLAVLIGLPRILMAMARDGLVPIWAAKVHPRTGTPIMTTIIATIVVSLSAGLLPIDAIASLTGVGTLTAFAAVCASVVVLRAREPNLPRPFRVPGPRWISLVGTLICLALILQLLPSLWLPLLMWMSLGAAIYALYGYRNSTLRRATAARNSSNMSTS